MQIEFDYETKTKTLKVTATEEAIITIALSLLFQRTKSTECKTMLEEIRNG